MSLLDTMKETFTVLDRTTVPDGLGGFSYQWFDGAPFDAVLRKDTSEAAVVAQQQGVNEIYTIIVNRATLLDFHDVFRRDSDGAVFRMTSSTRDAAAPAQSSVPIAKGTCERWALT